MARERLSHYFAVFNCHLNNASDRADAEFIKQFGQDKFDRHIAPYHEKGIMAIFEKGPRSYAGAWIVLCTAFVNEAGRRRSGRDHKAKDRGTG